jgi:hypothetical protein
LLTPPIVRATTSGEGCLGHEQLHEGWIANDTETAARLKGRHHMIALAQAWRR